MSFNRYKQTKKCSFNRYDTSKSNKKASCILTDPNMFETKAGYLWLLKIEL